MKETCRKVMQEDDRIRCERALAWARRPDVRNVANGIFYDDPLAGRDGIWVSFFIFPGTDPADIEKAKEEVVAKRDVVGFTLIEVPSDFGASPENSSEGKDEVRNG